MENKYIPKHGTENGILLSWGRVFLGDDSLSLGWCPKKSRTVPIVTVPSLLDTPSFTHTIHDMVYLPTSGWFLWFSWGNHGCNGKWNPMIIPKEKRHPKLNCLIKSPINTTALPLSSIRMSWRVVDTEDHTVESISKILFMLSLDILLGELCGLLLFPIVLKSRRWKKAWSVGAGWWHEDLCIQHWICSSNHLDDPKTRELTQKLPLFEQIFVGNPCLQKCPILHLGVRKMSILVSKNIKNKKKSQERACVKKSYSFSNNHGSVENGPLGDFSLILRGTIFHFHDYGRKGTSDYLSFTKTGSCSTASSKSSSRFMEKISPLDYPICPTTHTVGPLHLRKRPGLLHLLGGDVVNTLGKSSATQDWNSTMLHSLSQFWGPYPCYKGSNPSIEGSNDP